HAVAQTGWTGAVLEHMAEVRAAAAAGHLSPLHAITAVFMQFNIFFRDRLPKTGPARSGFKFGIRYEQRCSAAHAAIKALFVVVPVFSGKRPLCARVARDRAGERG